MTALCPARRGPLACAALLAHSLCLAHHCAAAEELRIGTVTVTTLNVFSPEEVARGWVYRVADSVRWITRESVIRRLLLFQDGDPYDPDRLAETERNLRALAFVKSASVEAGVPHDGVVDVRVVTQDAWTTEPGVSLGRKGGATTFGFNLTEKDLLGTGRQLTFDFDKGTERTTRLFGFRDPSVFGPYWLADLLYANNSDGGETRVSLSRPFFSLATPWSAGGSFDDLRQNEKLYGHGELAASFRQHHREVLAEYGRAMSFRPDRARRLAIGVDWLEDAFETLRERPADVLPESRRFHWVYVRYSDLSTSFVKRNYVNRDLRYEDFDLGAHLDAVVGLSPPAFGASAWTGLLRIGASAGRRLGPAAFALAAAQYGTRIERGPRNEILSTSVVFVRPFDVRPLQTFVARLRFTRGWNLDRDVQFAADGETGLRGYRLHSFTGDRSMVVNVEQRVFSTREILQLVAPGAAVFFDAGTATPPGTPLTFRAAKKDAGFGLRLGIPRAATNSVIRIDLAYAFDRDPLGRRGLLLSFSSSQAF